jgi:hypothetical protein
MNTNPYNIPIQYTGKDFIHNTIYHHIFDTKSKLYSRYIGLSNFGISLLIKLK